MAELEQGKPISLQEQAPPGRVDVRRDGRRRLKDVLHDHYVMAYAILGAVKFNNRQLYRHLMRIFCGWAFLRLSWRPLPSLELGWIKSRVIRLNSPIYPFTMDCSLTWAC